MKNKLLALKLLKQKIHDPSLTFPLISEKTGRRLPNDIIRFGIHDSDTLNRWFTAFYLPYIRSKFAFLPKDPHDSLSPWMDMT